MRRAIVTGATGFIGSWLVRELLDNGYSVAVVVRSRARLLPEFCGKCDVVEKTLQEIKASDFAASADIFFHLAWAGVSSEKKDQVDLQIENIKASLNVLEVAHGVGCSLFLAAGTVAEYALCDNVMDMAARQTPNDFYGAAKVAAYHFVEVRARQLGQPLIWSVIPSTFGEGRTNGNIITYTINSLLKGEKPVYGNLLQMWDFLYVKDVVRALRLIGERGIADKVYGIGSGEYRALRDYICSIRDVINPSLPLGIGENPSQSNRTFSSCIDNYDLKKDTGFQPGFTFEEGISRTVEYARKHLK